MTKNDKAADRKSRGFVTQILLVVVSKTNNLLPGHTYPFIGSRGHL